MEVGYDIGVLQRTACLLVGPVTVGGFSFLFCCAPVGRALDSVAVPTWGLVCCYFLICVSWGMVGWGSFMRPGIYVS